MLALLGPVIVSTFIAMHPVAPAGVPPAFVEMCLVVR